MASKHRGGPFWPPGWLEAKDGQRKGQGDIFEKGGGILIIAVDFDGVLCENKFPRIGAPNYDVMELVRSLIYMGHEVILWTSRAGQELEKAVKWCEEYGLNFTAVNENAPSNIAKYASQYPNGTRKVYADIYVDDHNLDCQMYAKHYSDEMVTKHIIDSLKEVLRWEEEN